jgi:O-antigen ligase
MKWLTVAAVAAVGMGLFAVRFHSYFASGATSVGARFDYWRAAVQVIREHPVVGSGPGTFQRPYSRLKNPEAEMARLVHNDYLEQFSDSGMVGGVAYAAWIATLLLVLGRRVWRARDPVLFAIFAGLLGWFVQGVSEFGLYVPALAWTAFCLAGWLLAWSSNRIDSLPATR